jgi:hypothetical protein
VISYDEWYRLSTYRHTRDQPPPVSAPTAPLPAEIDAEYIRRAVLEVAKNPNSDAQRGLRIERTTIRGALHLENLDVTVPIFFRECWFEQALRVWLMRGRTLSFEACTLKDGAELRGARIAGHLLLRNSRVEGPIVARDMKVEGQVDLSGSTLIYEGGAHSELASIADRECFGFSRSTAASLYWRDMAAKPQGRVVLRDAQVGSFVHDLSRNGLESWPERGSVVLDGFQYNRLDQMSAEQGLAWLDLQGEFVASSYSMLARGFHRLNLSQATEDVLSALKKREIAQMRSPVRRWANHLVFGAIGYGKSPSHALVIVLVLFLAHFGTSSFLSSHRMMQPVVNEFLLEPCFISPINACDRDTSDWLAVNVAGVGERRVPPTYPAFSPLAYSLESFLPVVQFDQRRYWEPSRLWLRILLSALAGIGLFLGGVFVGSVSGLLSPKVE